MRVLGEMSLHMFSSSMQNHDGCLPWSMSAAIPAAHCGLISVLCWAEPCKILLQHAWNDRKPGCVSRFCSLLGASCLWQLQWFVCNQKNSRMSTTQPRAFHKKIVMSKWQWVSRPETILNRPNQNWLKTSETPWQGICSQSHIRVWTWNLLSTFSHSKEVQQHKQAHYALFHENWPITLNCDPAWTCDVCVGIVPWPHVFFSAFHPTPYLLARAAVAVIASQLCNYHGAALESQSLYLET